MPAATNRYELIAITGKEFNKLAALLENVNIETAMQPDNEEISIKDVIGHRAHWTNLFFGWYQQGQENGKANIPATGYKWNQLKEYNANLRADQSDLSWGEVNSMLEDSHARLQIFLEHMSEVDLYGSPMKGGGNKWTTGRWVEASGASHYRSATKYVRARLRDK